ncbi:RDD family protein, partial [Mariniblastus sp.]|nr:RDD family protein [Mariniblastus sp.]
MASDDFNPYQSPLSTEAPPPQIDAGQPGALADRSARFVAFIIDMIIYATTVLTCLYFLQLMDRYFSEDQSWLEAAVFGMLDISIHYLLNGYLLATRGQTIGKLVLGIQIVDQATGKLISMRRIVLLRDLPTQLPILLTILFALFGEYDLDDITTV